MKDKVINDLLSRIAKLEYEIEKLEREKQELQVNGLRQETLFKLEIERLNKGLDELEELCKTKYYEKNTTDIDSIAIAGNLYVYMYKKIKELKGSDKE